ncbi:hypothetical protein L873DRAFT_1849733 [Choiromyces venosus 120613-1]|uniref:Uncharacterized protein n=1 Tax=Choiromyces venosus 120613-1 TaxID=1336337 RepID=A0A3N4IUB8_9PEZI|nr:hypothetical protein L873DRAFT_1849733 [Choiromyces venosus 120613-1]
MVSMSSSIHFQQGQAPDAMDSSLEVDVLERSHEDISEIFPLVSLNIDAILQLVCH